MALQKAIELVNQGKESLRLSEAALKEVTEQALHDPLTQLPNRSLFNDEGVRNFV